MFIMRLQKILILMLFAMFFVVNTMSASAAANDEEESATSGAIDDIKSVLENINCETQGVGNLLRTEKSHTCIPASFLNTTIMNIVSPGMYVSTMLRLHMNDEELFPGGCDRENRIEYGDQNISFSLCNNIKLSAATTKAVAGASFSIVKSALSGDDPWDDVRESWEEDVSKSKYHKIYRNKRDGNSGAMVDTLAGAPLLFPWRVKTKNDKMCVKTLSLIGWIPVGCKYIKEPYPISIYSDFLDTSSEGIEDVSELSSLTKCATMGSCYKRAYENSKTGVVMSAPIIECVKEMAAKLMISNSVCSFDEVSNVLGSNTRYSSSLFQFQQNMHRVVSALLTIYVVLFGMKILLAGDVPPKSEWIIFVLKFLFVVYFSVGININVGSSDATNRLDGMIEWVLPFLIGGMDQLSSWVMNASPSGLCDFSDVVYAESFEHLKVWDSLDCKVSHYLGLDMLQTLAAGVGAGGLDNLSFPIPPYIYLLIPAILSGQPALISLAIMYPLLVISVAAFLVSSTVVCIISIVILSVMAPIFVPLYLFEYTKGYFENWARLLLSFLLQPMVIVVFITTMFAVYDYGFYGTCKYGHKDMEFPGDAVGQSISMGVRSNIPGSSALGHFAPPGNRNVRYFFVDGEEENYESAEEFQGCKDSLGFMLNNPHRFLFDGDDGLLTDESMPWIKDNTVDGKKKFDFLGALYPTPGMMIDTVELLFEKIRKLAFALLTSCLILYVMYHFSAMLSEFAADMTGGISTANMGIKAQTIYKGGMAVAGAASAAAGGAGESSGGGAAPSGGASGDSVSTSRSGATDKVSTGGDSGGMGSKAMDKVASKITNPLDASCSVKTSIASEKQPASESDSKSTDEPLDKISDDKKDEGEQ